MMANKQKKKSQKQEQQSKHKKHKCEQLNDDGTKCEESFDRKDNFIRHVRLKHAGYVYQCSKAQCNYWSRSTQRLSEHNSSTHKLSNGGLSLEEQRHIRSCYQCGFHFINEKHFDNHKRICVSKWEYVNRQTQFIPSNISAY